MQAKNAAYYCGYSGWRLPNTKKLESLVDYSNAPDYNSLPAIDTLLLHSGSTASEFSCRGAKERVRSVLGG